MVPECGSTKLASHQSQQNSCAEGMELNEERDMGGIWVRCQMPKGEELPAGQLGFHFHGRSTMSPL